MGVRNENGDGIYRHRFWVGLLVVMESDDILFKQKQKHRFSKPRFKNKNTTRKSQ